MSCRTIQSEFLGLISLMSLSTSEILITTIMYEFLPQLILQFFCFVWTLELVMKHLKKAEGHIDRNVVNVRIKVKTIIQIL